MSSTRWLIATVAGVLVIATAAVLVSRVQRPQPQPEGTPEAAVQRFLQAVADDDLEAVRAAYTPEVRDRCDERGPGRPWPPGIDRRSFSADLLDTRRIDDDTVDVEVRITEYDGDPPFGGEGYDHREVIRVERVDGRWAIADTAWPYYGCPG